MTTNGSDNQKNSKAIAIFIAGLIAGTLDITCACISAYTQRGVMPSMILRYVAAGLFGMKDAMSGSLLMEAAGLIIHYVIAFAWTILYFIIYPYFKLLHRNIFLSAIFYGLFVWAVMNLVVVPLTRIPPGNIRLRGFLIGAGILIIAIGLPLSILAKRFYGSRRD